MVGVSRAGQVVGVKRGVGVTVVGVWASTVQTVVGAKHGFRATSDAQQQQIRAVAVEAPCWHPDLSRG